MPKAQSPSMGSADRQFIMQTLKVFGGLLVGAACLFALFIAFYR